MKYAAGPLAFVEDGDQITVDANSREINLEVDDSTLAARRAAWSPPKPYATRGALAKYAHLVSTASLGAVTTPE